MDQSRNNPGQAQAKSRNRGQTRSPERHTAHSISPLDALVRGLVSIGERFFKGGRAQLRIP
ncbi:MAG TPA: hypothetical protein VK990_09340 [Acidimicrobiia bacterium]|nr:hypothetical protein [Acidimicrobiia bacterium]